jgi:hypothetical protein
MHSSNFHGKDGISSNPHLILNSQLISLILKKYGIALTRTRRKSWREEKEAEDLNTPT